MHENIKAIKKIKSQVGNLIFVLQELEKTLCVKIAEMDKLKDEKVSILDDINKYFIISNILEKTKDKNGKSLERKATRLISDAIEELLA